jgi:hypothetical protein
MLSLSSNRGLFLDHLRTSNGPSPAVLFPALTSGISTYRDQARSGRPGGNAAEAAAYAPQKLATRLKRGTGLLSALEGANQGRRQIRG